jgi:hypothetical protein
MHRQASQAQSLRMNRMTSFDQDVEMRDETMSAPPPSTISSPFSRPSAPQPESCADFAQLSEILRGRALFKEVLKTVKARILRDTDLEPEYAKKRVRRARRAMSSQLDSVSLLAGETLKDKNAKDPAKVRRTASARLAGVNWRWHLNPDNTLIDSSCPN